MFVKNYEKKEKLDRKRSEVILTTNLFNSKNKLNIFKGPLKKDLTYFPSFILT